MKEAWLFSYALVTVPCGVYQGFTGTEPWIYAVHTIMLICLLYRSGEVHSKLEYIYVPNASFVILQWTNSDIPQIHILTVTEHV